MSMYGKDMCISSLLVMITLSLNMYIGNLMSWIHIEIKAGSNNLLSIHTKSRRLNQDDMSSKFDSLLEHKIIS